MKGTKLHPNTIHLPVQEPPPCDWQTAARHIAPYGDVVCVEMDPPAQQVGALVLPERVAGRLRCDCGTVIALGPEVDEIAAGDRVLVLPFEGNWFDGFDVGPYKAKGEVRIYGVCSRDEFLHISEEWDVNIPAKIEDGVKAVGRWVFIRRDPEEGTIEGIELPESQRFRSQKATVINAGKNTCLKPGDRVIYHGRGLMLDFEFGDKYITEGNPKDYALIKEDDLYAVIREDA